MSLGIYREKINEIDSQILALFKERMEIVKKVADYKMANNMEVFQPEREKEVIEMRKNSVESEYQEYAEELFLTIMKLSRDMQNKIINK